MTRITYENDETLRFSIIFMMMNSAHKWCTSDPRLVRMKLNMVRYFLLQEITIEVNEGQKDRLKSQNDSIICDQVFSVSKVHII